jgi:hypothetical protein
MCVRDFLFFFRYSLVVITVVSNTDLHAQKINLSDSLAFYFKMPAVPALKLDTRNSFITGSNVRIYGVKAGLIFGKRISVGIGYNWLGSKEERKFVEEGTNTSYDAKLRFSFVSPYIEYVFYQKRALSMSIPVQIGFGYSKLHYYDGDGNLQVVSKQFVAMYEPAMTIEHRFLKYFAAGGGVGFRLMLKNNTALDERFSAPIYLLRFRILFEELYRDFSKAEDN